MKIFECKCGSKDIFIKDSGNNKGLYCANCGKWMQWLGKDDLRLAERQIEQSIVNPIPKNIDELKEHDAKLLDKVKTEIKNWQGDIHDNEYDADKFDFVFERLFEIIAEIEND